jgi:hypothetical protein
LRSFLSIPSSIKAYMLQESRSIAKSVVHGSTSDILNNTEWGSEGLEDLLQGIQTNQADPGGITVEQNLPNRIQSLEFAAQIDPNGMEPFSTFSDREVPYNMVSSSSKVVVGQTHKITAESK